MGLKQAAADPISDAKKRRRVGFNVVDVGIEANECIKIYLVNSKDEVDAASGFLIEPIDLNQFFGEDGKIYGYKDLKIIIWLSTISLHAYADITFQSTSEGGRGITDLKPALQNIFGESLVEKKDDFLDTFTAESHYIRTIISNGEVIHYKAPKGHNGETNGCLESEASSVEVICMPVNSMPVGQLYSRLVPLALLLVDGSSPIDITDPKWEIYLVVQRTDQQGDINFKLIGFAAVYRFYKYPDDSRLRISQILVLPPYQGQGHGRHLLEVLNHVAVSEKMYDVTVEEPSDYLQHVRTCIDTLRLLAFDSIQPSINLAVLHLKQGKFSEGNCRLQLDPSASVVEDVRKNLKINKKQFIQCWEVLIYLGLGSIDQYMENYMTFISERIKIDILGKESDTAGKRVIEVPNDYDHDMTFVMFRTQTGGEAGGAQIDKTQTNQEEQLRQLAEGRMKEIKLVAEKVSSRRV
ncbi:PREDICTED: histone acetyltransferase type B catalytic subunit [Nelumbo nucifera]|uniref:histone acetyltransferase n=1 Tax=Nelumbo nucifera TaxID=4432 RepID=A0A1U8ALY4_NELNU|nr:PREDICTED: histone acetyltransferase type B catalytic subunit [Nelumbo nucifera]